jgi:hypothetical protein
LMRRSNFSLAVSERPPPEPRIRLCARSALVAVSIPRTPPPTAWHIVKRFFSPCSVARCRSPVLRAALLSGAHFVFASKACLLFPWPDKFRLLSTDRITTALAFETHWQTVAFRKF